MDNTLEAFTQIVDNSRLHYHLDLEKEAHARGDVHAGRRAARDAKDAEAALRNDQSRWFREGLTKWPRACWEPALRAMVFGG